jgi:hypothetical protein
MCHARPLALPRNENPVVIPLRAETGRRGVRPCETQPGDDDSVFEFLREPINPEKIREASEGTSKERPAGSGTIFPSSAHRKVVQRL